MVLIIDLLSDGTIDAFMRWLIALALDYTTGTAWDYSKQDESSIYGTGSLAADNMKSSNSSEKPTMIPNSVLSILLNLQKIFSSRLFVGVG